MSFCHNCGTPHTNDDMFCPNCGVKVDSASNDVSTGDEASSGFIQPLGGINPQMISTTLRVAAQLTQFVVSTLFDIDLGIDMFKSGDSRPALRGLILTDVSRLSRRFSVPAEQVNELLSSYISALDTLGGVEYSLLDVSNPTGTDRWEDYSMVLTDVHVSHYKGSKDPVFLFIIGGDDIIPMPIIENLYYHARVAAGSTNYNDKDIDTDLPYAYLLGTKTQELIYNGELFNYRPYYCVGRLPLDSTSDITVLRDYLQRSFDCHKRGGVNIDSSYAQTFRNWCNESVITSSVLNQESLLPPYSSQYDAQFTFHNMLTSPGVVVENIQPVFNTNAKLLFFNMHGSDNPANPNFMGETISFSPRQLESLTDANIVVTEACYGAKFKGLDRSKSMLLSALRSKSVNYFGSSRIALGGGGGTYASAENLISADLYFKYLLDALTLTGYPVAYSVECARAKYIKSCRKLKLTDILTIAEFNLYGDPAIRSRMVAEGSAPKAEEMKIAPLAEGKGDCGFKVEPLYEKSDSLLSMIRNRVDSSLKEIVDTVNKELYASHGIQPRDLSIITKTKYKDNSSSMEFVYNTQSGDIDKVYVVQVEDGVKSVLISK